MRSVLLFLVIAVAGGWAALRHLPSSQADTGTQSAEVLTLSKGLPAVLGVSIEGRHLPLAELRGVLTTQAGALIDGAALEHDRRAIQQALIHRGHLDAQARPAVVTHASGGAWVVFEADKGALFRLRDIVVTGASERETGVVTLGRGEIATAARIERARTALAENLARRGKPSVVTAVTRIDHEATALDVELVVTAR